MGIFLSGNHLQRPATVWQSAPAGGWRYAVTNRADGNVSFRYGTSQDTGQARTSIYQRLGVNPAAVLPLRLDVSYGVHWLDERPPFDGLSPVGFPSEGVWTTDAGVVPLIFVADCFPVGLYDPGRGALGIFHAGRAELSAGLFRRMLELGKEHGVNPVKLNVFIGPGICQAHYVFDRVPDDHVGAATQDGQARWHLDLLDDLQATLQAFGVNRDRIFLDGRCTYESPELFSHRREAGMKEGRFALLVQRYG